MGLQKTLISIQEQTFRDLEHIVIDGGSTDKSTTLLKKYERLYNLSWSSEPDEGIADALNKGILRARGHYLIVIHADDRLIRPSILQDIYPLLRDETADILCFPIIMEHPRYGSKIFAPAPSWKIRIRTIFPHQGTFIHRRLHDQIGNYDTQYAIAMDYDFFYRAVMAKKKIVTEKQPITLMDGTGVGSIPETRHQRRKENFRARFLHERNLLWRGIHLLGFIARVQWPTMVQKIRRVR